MFHRTKRYDIEGIQKGTEYVEYKNESETVRCNIIRYIIVCYNIV